MAPRNSRPRPVPKKAQGKDSDGDRLTDAEERRFGSDPRRPDTDGDGVGDFMEWAIRSNPRNPDTDGDGLPDQEELEVTGTAVVERDTDLDGLGDGEEVRIRGSNPHLADSDRDGLRDDVELGIGTSLLRDDSDGDGIVDGLEVGLGLDPSLRHDPGQARAIVAGNPLPTITDLNLDGSDQDRDGYANWIERYRGTDPDDELKVPVPNARTVPRFEVPVDPNPRGGRSAVEPPELDPVTGQPRAEQAVALSDDPVDPEGALTAVGSPELDPIAGPSPMGEAAPTVPDDPTVPTADGGLPLVAATSTYAPAEPTDPPGVPAYDAPYDDTAPTPDEAYGDTYGDTSYA